MILAMLLGIIYVLYLYQQWTLDEDINDSLNDETKQLDYVENDSDEDMDDEVYKQDSDLGSTGSDGLSFLDQQTNVSTSSLFF